MNDPAPGDATYRAPDLTLVGAEHVRRYRETGGEVGYEWNGVTALLLTTTGRTSGEPRTSAVEEPARSWLPHAARQGTPSARRQISGRRKFSAVAVPSGR